jgi:putative hydrolase of the HAD superfamily
VLRYRAILFDLFGTVALFDLDKLPLFEWEGQTSRSTLGVLRSVCEQKLPEVPFTRFFTAHADVLRELWEARSRELREVPCMQRFLLTLMRAGLADSAATRRIAEELSLAHSGLLESAAAVPPAHANFLDRTCARYNVALVSNFDHGPTARRILAAGGVERHFHHIVISEEHGRRKPHPEIFTDTLLALGVKPGEALFVGDSPAEDIAGAKGVGMDVAWVNPAANPLPDGTPFPDYTVRAIPELERILFA